MQKYYKISITTNLITPFRYNKCRKLQNIYIINYILLFYDKLQPCNFYFFIYLCQQMSN